MSAFSITRSVQVGADPDQVHALINDFRRWLAWSPWEAIDPGLVRQYLGPSSGVGAVYEWTSPDEAVSNGRIEMTGSSASRLTLILDLGAQQFVFETMQFDLEPVGEGTEVTWNITGTTAAPMSPLARRRWERGLTADFDRGLAAIKAIAEG